MIMKPVRIDKSRKWVGVCISPALIDQFELESAIVVVIDVLRATTSMCVAFDKGVRSMIPVLTTEEGLAYKKKGYLTAGERDGMQVEGFDFGNSPFSFMSDDLKGKDIVITTTNGTKAIKAAVERGAKEVVVGSFPNLSALTEYLIQKNENVVFVCSGWKDKPNLEDTAFAGAMVNKLRPYFRLYEDTALIAEALFKAANRRKRYYMRSSSHFNRLYHILQIQKDVKYSLRRDTHPVIPKLLGDHLVEINSPYYAEFEKKALLQAEKAKATADKAATAKEKLKTN
jgi:2-phosphosulfolactate phosphatase